MNEDELRVLDDFRAEVAEPDSETSRGSFARSFVTAEEAARKSLSAVGLLPQHVEIAAGFAVLVCAVAESPMILERAVALSGAMHLIAMRICERGSSLRWPRPL